MSDSDLLQRFLFEGLPIRGKFVRLGAAWQAVLARGDYPDPVRWRLGNALAAAPLMAATLKFEGELIMQLQGEGPMHLLVAQTDDALHIRGLARWNAEVPEAPLAEQCRDGRLVITLQPEGRQRYQGIVPIESDDLASCLESYFEISEQLPTCIMLAADSSRAAGLLLQRIPGEMPDADAWERVSSLAATVKESELLDLPFDQILHRLFHEEIVRVFESQPVSFRCSCRREKISDVLRSLGQEEVRSILEDQRVIAVHCEFCNKSYEFDAVDAEALFADHQLEGPGTVQ